MTILPRGLRLIIVQILIGEAARLCSRLPETDEEATAILLGCAAIFKAQHDIIAKSYPDAQKK